MEFNFTPDVFSFITQNASSFQPMLQTMASDARVRATMLNTIHTMVNQDPSTFDFGSTVQTVMTELQQQFSTDSIQQQQQQPPPPQQGSRSEEILNDVLGMFTNLETLSAATAQMQYIPANTPVSLQTALDLGRLLDQNISGLRDHVEGVGQRIEAFLRAHADTLTQAQLIGAKEERLNELNRVYYDSSEIEDNNVVDFECHICTNVCKGRKTETKSETTSSVIELPCGHAFDEECILTWLRRVNSCPFCRASV